MYAMNPDDYKIARAIEVMDRECALTASNYIYLNPISTMVTSGIVLHEHMTWMASLGSLFILVGVFLANKGTPKS